MKFTFYKKIIILAVVAIACLLFARLPIRDELLLLYVVAAVLFGWSGGFVLFLGVILEILIALSQYYEHSGLIAPALYPWLLMGGGAILLMRQWWRDATPVWHANRLQGVRFAENARLILKTAPIGRLYYQLVGRFSIWDRCRVAIIVGAAVMLIAVVHLPFDAVVFFTFFVYLLLFAPDSRLPAFGAMGFFVAAAILANMRINYYANLCVDYGYYCSWMIIAIELKRWGVEKLQFRFSVKSL